MRNIAAALILLLPLAGAARAQTQTQTGCPTGWNSNAALTSAGAWIDVLKDGTAMASTVHGHETGCADLRKMVSFPLTQGRHVIQLSGNKEATIKLLVSQGR